MGNLVIEALEESVEFLQEENSRLRNRNRILVSINVQIRRQLARAYENDEQFKQFCDEEIETDFVPEQGGLPEAGDAVETDGHERQ